MGFEVDSVLRERGKGGSRIRKRPLGQEERERRERK